SSVAGSVSSASLFCGELQATAAVNIPATPKSIMLFLMLIFGDFIVLNFKVQQKAIQKIK
ncbi:MAG TPA: hypothetical protein VD772_08205, partial [Anseongella sp.]|nr:hypothetical protein [Anseongella sp.]